LGGYVVVDNYTTLTRRY